MSTLKEKAKTLLIDPNKSIIEAYREIEELYISDYGDNTVLLIEVGSFFEIYCPTVNDKYHDKIKSISDILNIQLTKRNNNNPDIDFKNPMLVGFNSISLDKFLFFLVNESKYNVVLIKQDGIGKGATRFVDQVITSGINIDYKKEDIEDHYIASLNIDVINEMFIVGISIADISTGKVFIGEFISSKEDKTIALDEAFNIYQAYNIKESIINLKDKSIDLNYIKSYLALSKDTSVNCKYENIKLSYQNSLFKTIYSIKSQLSSIEHLGLERTPYLCESLAYLFDYIQNLNSEILKDINLPIFLNNDNFVYIGNNSMEQLGVISNNKNDITLLNIINNCQTAFGKRNLKERLLNPIIDKIELERRYKLSESLAPIIFNVEESLRGIRDIEKMRRRIDMGKLNPMDIPSLVESLESILELDKIVSLPLNLEKSKVLDYVSEINRSFDLDEISKYTLNNIESSFIKSGISAEIDTLILSSENEFNKLLKIKNLFEKEINLLIAKPQAEIFNLLSTDRDGYYLRTTKTKYNMFKNFIKKININIDGEVISFEDFNPMTTNTGIKFMSQYFSDISNSIEFTKGKVVKLTSRAYISKLEEFSNNYSETLNGLVYFISDIDIALNNIKLSKKYSYVKPEILDSQNNIIEAIDLRHVLVERNQDLGIYIPNNIFFGNKLQADHPELMLEDKDEINGALLYGLNSAGKSTNTRAIGLAIIMAQAGMFVPASKFRFSLFDSIFTRILGVDNPMRGLSTFAVEMLELKNIFKRATKKSLVLGDEVSKGSEYLSGVAIVASAILKFKEIGLTYLFATHLHQIPKLEIINKIEDLIYMHLDVYYDEVKELMIYNRKLLSGSGKDIYGLEFAKSLNMDDVFIKNAYDIRATLIVEENKKDNSIIKQSNRYNSNLYLDGNCTLCDEKAEEIHHIMEQSKASLDKNVNHMNINHKYNLVPLCKKHHKAIHDYKGVEVPLEYKQTSNGLELFISDEFKQII